jgi:hypothetical protein
MSDWFDDFVREKMAKGEWVGCIADYEIDVQEPAGPGIIADGGPEVFEHSALLNCDLHYGHEGPHWWAAAKLEWMPSGRPLRTLTRAGNSYSVKLTDSSIREEE